MDEFDRHRMQFRWAAIAPSWCAWRRKCVKHDIEFTRTHPDWPLPMGDETINESYEKRLRALNSAMRTARTR